MSRLTCPDIRSPSTFLRIFAPWRLCVKISERHPRRPDTESAPDALRPGYLGSSRPAPDSVVHVFRVSRHQAEAACGDRAQGRVGGLQHPIKNTGQEFAGSFRNFPLRFTSVFACFDAMSRRGGSESPKFQEDGDSYNSPLRKFYNRRGVRFRKRETGLQFLILAHLVPCRGPHPHHCRQLATSSVFALLRRDKSAASGGGRDLMHVLPHRCSLGRIRLNPSAFSDTVCEDVWEWRGSKMCSPCGLPESRGTDCQRRCV